MGVPAGEGNWAQQGRRHPPALTHPQCGDLGAEGADLWLAASSDQRISIWASDWPRGHCELLDWLSSPSPTLTEVRLLVARAAGTVACPPHHSTLCPPQFSSRPPPCLVAFCPWDGALLACAGLGVHPEVVFYSLHQKQARAPPTPAWCPEPGGSKAGEGRLMLAAHRWWRRSHFLSLLCP